MFASTASLADSQFYGLLRSRDLTTFGFLRLDMRPAYAVSIDPGSWAIETELSYQNTWALSPEVEKYMVSLEPTGRRDLGLAEFEAIKALPGENYLLDVESANFDLTFHYKLSTHWTGYVIASAVSYQGGFLDDTIEGFHDAFGFSSFGRPAASKNDVNLIYDLKSAQVANFGSPTDGGFTDPTIGVRYTGLAPLGKWAFSMEGAVKVPVAGERTLLSTGKTDVGLQASLQRFGDNHALYLCVAGVYYSGADFPVKQDAQIVPTLVFGYERTLTSRTNVNLQGYVSRSVYTRDETDLEELLGEKYQLTLGIRHRLEQFLISFGITENLQNINNTPDIGFQLGLAYIPSRVKQMR
jgi:hypothetical protein